MNKNAGYIAKASIVAALYAILTLFTSAFGFSSGVIQFRLSEALCVLPAYMPAAVPGLFLGCLLANIVSGLSLWDIVIGSLATLIGALGTYLLRKNKFLSIFPPILSNSILVPLTLMFVYGIEKSYLVLFISVFISEVISCGLLGQLVSKAYKKIQE